jgi:hypothetical protein
MPMLTLVIGAFTPENQGKAVQSRSDKQYKQLEAEVAQQLQKK